MILHNTNFLFVFLYSTPKNINHKLISFIPLHSIISFSIFFNIQIFFIIFSNFLAYKGNIFFKNYYFFHHHHRQYNNFMFCYFSIFFKKNGAVWKRSIIFFSHQFSWRTYSTCFGDFLMPFFRNLFFSNLFLVIRDFFIWLMTFLTHTPNKKKNLKCTHTDDFSITINYNA